MSSSLRLLLLVSVSLFIGQCSAQNNVACKGTKAGDDCWCSSYGTKTRNGTTDTPYCPEGYYCPLYTLEQVKDALLKWAFVGYYSTCEISLTTKPYVQCQCTLGFYCPENVALPTYCCKGFQCSNVTTIEVCPKGKFCQTGYVKGVDCSGLSSCPEGTENPKNVGAIVFICILFLLLFVMYRINGWRHKLQTTQEDASVKAHKSEKEKTPPEFGLELSASTKTGAASKYLKAASKSDEVTPAAETEVAVSPAGYKIEFENFEFVLKSGRRLMGTESYGVDGTFFPGQLTAVMGPSGAGKSTILNLITGKAEKTGGTLRINGQEEQDLSHLKELFGFVPQEDIMLRELSVRENIAFSARTRLPASWPADQVDSHVDGIIADLQLGHVQSSRIGDAKQRGISGGQRKRVNIGIEMAADPIILFLDEPTSGLDSTTSFQLVDILKKFAIKKQMTVASVIHQPSIQTFMGFDRLLLLGTGGCVVYEGPVSEGMKYFQDQGFQPPAIVNPADFFLDIANGVVETDSNPDFVVGDLFDMWQNHRKEGGEVSKSGRNRLTKLTSDSAALQDHAEPIQDWSDCGGNCSRVCASLGAWFSAECSWLGEWCSDIASDLSGIFNPSPPARVTPGFFAQFKWCFLRGVRQTYFARGFSSLISEMMLFMVLGLVCGSIPPPLWYLGPFPAAYCYLQSESFQTQCSKAQADGYAGAMIFLAFAIVMCAVVAASMTFSKEVVNYYRESAAGLKTPPYFISKVCVDIPRMLLGAMFFNAAYSLTLADTSEPGDLFLLILLMFWCCFALGYFVALVVGYDAAPLTGVMVALMMLIVFGGTTTIKTKDIKTLPIPIKWIWSASPLRWATEAYEVSQLQYFDIYDGIPYMNIDTTLSDTGFGLNSYSRNMWAMFWCGLGWNIVTLICMASWNKDKKK